MPLKLSHKQSVIGIALIVTIVALDQSVKNWVLALLEANAYRPLELTSFANLVLVVNTGVSFGLFGSDGNQTHWLLILLPGLVTVWLFVWMLRARVWLVVLGLASVIGGALGNIADRIFRPGVVDFFDFHVAGWHFWAFNVADSAISIGVVLILYDAFFGDQDVAR